MQVNVSSVGNLDSYALLLLLTHLEDDGRVVRYFVCCECRDLVEAVQGWDYVHTCESGDFADGVFAGASIQRRKVTVAQ